MKLTDHKKDRLCYILEELFNYLITILVTGSYLAKITSYLGFSDSLTAILSSFVTLGCSTQMLSGLVFRKGMIKRQITAVFTVTQLLFLLLYLVPFVQIPIGVRTVVFVGMLLLGHLMRNVALAPRTNWYMSFVDNSKRGTFTAKKEAVSLAVGFAFQMAMGAMMDAYEAQGNLQAAFVVCAVVIFGVSIAHTLSLVFTQDQEIPNRGESLGQDLRNVFTDKKVRCVFGLSALWAVAYSVSTPFYGTYTIKELGLSMSFLAVLSLAGAVSRILASIFLGKYADKYSFAKMLRLCYILKIVSFLSVVFAVPSNGKVMYTIFTIVGSMAFGGINSATINLIFDYVKPEKRTTALAVNQAVYGIVGFLASTAATPFLEAIQNAGNRFLGMEIYAQQVLSALACVCTLLVMIYLERVVLKMERVQEN